MSAYLVVLCLIAAAWCGVRLIPTDPPKPRRIPEHVISGRRARIVRNRGRWGL